MAVTLEQVESFEITVTGASDTVTLTTPVASLATAWVWWGMRSNTNSAGANHARVRLTATDTVTINRNATSEVTIIGYVMEFSAGVTVDHFAYTVDASGTDNTALSGGLTDLTKIFVVGCFSLGGTVWGEDDNFVVFAWDDSSTLKVQTHTGSEAGQDFGVQVIQYDDCSVTRGSNTTMASGDSSEVITSLAAVDRTKTLLCHYLTSAGGDPAGEILVRSRMTSDTEITFDRDVTGVAIDDLRWERIEFTGNETVQEVLSSFVATDAQNDETITAVSGLTKAATWASFMGHAGKANESVDDYESEGFFTHDLTTTTNLQIKRNRSVRTADVAVYVVDFGAAAAAGRIMSSLVGAGGLAARGGIAGPGGGLAG